MATNIRFGTLDNQNMDPHRWNQIIVLADNASGETLYFNSPTADSDITFISGTNQALFAPIAESNTFMAVAMIQYTGTATSTSFEVSTDDINSDGTLTINWKQHDVVSGIIVLQDFAKSDLTATKTTQPTDYASAKVKVTTGSGQAAAAKVQVSWYPDVDSGYLFFYDKAGTPIPDNQYVDGKYLLLTDSNGESQIHIASKEPITFSLKATVMGEQTRAFQSSITLANLNFETANPYDPLTINDQDPQYSANGTPAIVIKPGQTDFSVTLPDQLASLPTSTELFFDLNDLTCPLIISGGNSYSKIQSIPLHYLDFSTQADPHLQTISCFTTVDAQNPNISIPQPFLVYGTYTNAPDPTIKRSLPMPPMERDGGTYLDLYMITPELDFTIPANASAMSNVQVTIYCNGYVLGRDNVPKTIKQTFPITQLGANSNTITANTAVNLHIDFKFIAGYTRNSFDQYGFFYLEYTAEINTPGIGQIKYYSYYPTRKMATA